MEAMATNATGGGDPARTLELLWRDGTPPTNRRGPRPGLSIDAVVGAATRLTDVEGLQSLTMRRVAGELSVSPMTLYTYVPGKAELLDLMVDAAYGRMQRADTHGQAWRARLTVIAEENRTLYATHRWVAEVSTLRPPLGPGLIAKYDHELAALDGLGLTDLEMDAALTYLLGFVRSWARDSADVLAQRNQAPDDRQWWEANAPLLQRVLDPTAYPLATRVGTTAGEAHGAAYNPAHSYEFGLARILDGLAVLIEPVPSGVET